MNGHKMDVKSNTLREEEDYQAHFDTQAYLTNLFSKPEDFEFLRFIMDSLYEIYSPGDVGGHRIIDIGSGPTIHTVIPAAENFDEVCLSDFSKTNREALEKWVRNDPSSHNWQPFFRYIARKMDKEDTSDVYEESLREKITGVYACDVHLPNPLEPETLGLFDVVCTSNTLAPASRNMEQYIAAQRNVLSLLSPGGHLIMMGVLNNPYYTVGNVKFPSVSLSLSEVKEFLEKEGLNVVKCFESKEKLDSEYVSYDGAFVLLAKKP